MSDDLNPSTPPPPPQHQTDEPQSAAAQPNVGYQPPRPAYPYGPQYAGPYGNPYGAGFYPPRKPRSAWFWPVIIFGSLLIIGLLLWAMVWAAMHSSDDGASPTFGSSRIAVIDVTGVIVDADKIDTQLRKLTQDWTLERQAAPDRNILRMTAYEILFSPETPVAAVINEAVELAKKYSTADSGRFVNGVLGALARCVPRGQGQLGDDECFEPIEMAMDDEPEGPAGL